MRKSEGHNLMHPECRRIRVRLCARQCVTANVYIGAYEVACEYGSLYPMYANLSCLMIMYVIIVWY